MVIIILAETPLHNNNPGQRRNALASFEEVRNEKYGGKYKWMNELMDESYWKEMEVFQKMDICADGI